MVFVKDSRRKDGQGEAWHQLNPVPSSCTNGELLPLVVFQILVYIPQDHWC